MQIASDVAAALYLIYKWGNYYTIYGIGMMNLAVLLVMLDMGMDLIAAEIRAVTAFFGGGGGMIHSGAARSVGPQLDPGDQASIDYLYDMQLEDYTRGGGEDMEG